MSTPSELADLAESLVPVAARLIGAVHDDGVGEVARVLSAVNPAELPALCVVLAGMVDPDKSVAELLAWVTWDECPKTPQPTLFGAASAVDDETYVLLVEDELLRPVRQWSDTTCKRMWSDWRKRQAGRPVADGNPVLERRGFTEWEKRRKRAWRAAAKYQESALTEASTGVSSML